MEERLNNVDDPNYCENDIATKLVYNDVGTTFAAKHQKL